MKTKSFDFRQIEWWITTLLFVSIVLFNLTSINSHRWLSSGSPSYAKIFIPTALYVTFYIFHMRLIPNYLSTKKIGPLVGFGILTLGLGFLFSSILTIGLNSSFENLFQLYLGVIFLYISHQGGSLVLKGMFTPPRFPNYFFYNLSRLILTFIVLIFFLFLGQKTIIGESVIIVFLIFLPVILGIVTYNFFLIYGKRKAGKQRQANWFTALLLIAVFMLFMIIGAYNNKEEVILIGFLVNGIILLIINPLSNLIFKKYESMTGQILNLTTEVNQGNANLDFLRSQINPHFLFNALNTLYASALMENAEKTSDGIQKLGDMMRFMLHENQQAKIPLSREIDYLRNYIDLQMLRFGAQSNLEVDFQINDDSCKGMIAPMLLIPFLENAFKHGISAKEKSWIRMNLRCISGSVHVDLVNSVHASKSKEKSEESSGIGLDNVKKRLNLVYPNRHQLNIISNDTDFFVHFSVQIQ
ncbi:sensor histidine kinase [Algoriphagus limi]|uniref:Sensor histidine kinase n=1 Tax=Algoriphagus limi TaxID=2975273 RepID=A0ABT2G630_9BACT|nr:sensor histidine kinase [Algoriphagus limi]MCS5489460.1 sensor histidine kinase [Algoriphagus limi]